MDGPRDLNGPETKIQHFITNSNTKNRKKINVMYIQINSSLEYKEINLMAVQILTIELHTYSTINESCVGKVRSHFPTKAKVHIKVLAKIQEPSILILVNPN